MTLTRRRFYITQVSDIVKIKVRVLHRVWQDQSGKYWVNRPTPVTDGELDNLIYGHLQTKK
jgi:hypothetical protein